MAFQHLHAHHLTKSTLKLLPFLLICRAAIETEGQAVYNSGTNAGTELPLWRIVAIFHQGAGRQQFQTKGTVK
jgi:hypothetical protein